MNIIYTEDPHKYIVDGIEYPALSTFMQDMGLYGYEGVPEHIMKKAADLGKAVHKATHLIDIDQLGSYDPLIQPYIDAYNKFKKKIDVKFLEWEKSVANKALKLATTLDRVGIINDVISDIEIKTTSALMKKSIRIQTAGHKYIYNSMGYKNKIKDRYVLWLKPTGKYELIPLKDPKDEILFLSGARWYRFREE